MVAAPVISPGATELKVRESRMAALVPAKDKAKPLPEKAAAAAPSSDAADPTMEPVKVTPVKALLVPVPKGDKLGSWHAQLGATQNAAAIRAKLKEILDHNSPAQGLPSGLMVRNVEGRTFYRAWLGSYDSRQEALSLCKALKGVPAGGCAIFKGATMEARND